MVSCHMLQRRMWAEKCAMNPEPGHPSLALMAEAW